MEFDFARSAAVASGLLLEAIHRYKYQRELWYENFLGPLLVEAAAPSLQDGGWNLIVPVPLHPVKKREREFNQAVRLARLLGSACRIPVQANLLRRVRATQTQTRLHRQERRSNMAGAFAPTTGFRLSGQSVVVVDDVLTTGSTTSECASVLRSLGASRVAVWTVARGL